MIFNRMKIYIYYPSRITGGAEFLLKTVADLIKRNFYVCVVDIREGWLSSNIEDVEFIFLDNDKKINLDQDSILITTANLVRYIDINFEGDFKVLAWIVQVNNMIPTLPRMGGWQHQSFFKKALKYTLLYSEYKKLSRLAFYLESKKSLYIMDDACNDVFYRYFDKRLKNYLPVVIPDEKIKTLEKLKKKKTNEFYCVWLGRLDNDFKNPILEHVLLSLDNFSIESEVNIVFDIIGKGPGLKSAKDVAAQVKKIKINFLGEKRGDELAEIIQSHDIGFAMGTSALEIAACGVPVVLLDASYGKVPASYRYQWLFESTGYCIGRSIDAASDKTLGNKKTIKDLIDEIINDHENIRDLCYLHVKKYHSIKVLQKKLFLAIQENKSNFQEMQASGLLEKPYWHFIKEFL